MFTQQATVPNYLPSLACMMFVTVRTKLTGQIIRTCGLWELHAYIYLYEGWNFNSGNYLFTTDTK